MKSRKALTLGSLVVLFAFATATQAQDKKPTAKGIDPATVATYEKAGATYGGTRTERRRIEEIAVLVDMWKDPYATNPSIAEFVAGHEAAKRYLPPFEFRRE